MEHARRVLQQHIGTEEEEKVYQQCAHDLDEYIEVACSERANGLWCSRCKQNTAVVELLQTRSADEGMTAYLVCHKCNWRKVFS